MKIDATNITQSISAGSGEPGRAKPAAFGGYLEQALNSLHPEQDTTVSHLPPATTMPVFINQPPQAKNMQAIEQANRILAGLDDYQAKLGDPAVSLKEVGASLERLEDEVRQVAPMLEQLDEHLLDILESVSGLAVVEAIKFRRGDYT